MLQSLVDAPCLELAVALGFGESKARKLQDTLQRVLDRREEERQSKELLQLYLKAMEKEGRETSGQEGETQGCRRACYTQEPTRGRLRAQC